LRNEEYKAIQLFAEFARVCGDSARPEKAQDFQTLANDITADLARSGTISSPVFEKIYATLVKFAGTDVRELKFFNSTKEFASAFMSAMQKIRSYYLNLTSSNFSSSATFQDLIV
jgi:hypothetical protein